MVDTFKYSAGTVTFGEIDVAKFSQFIEFVAVISHHNGFGFPSKHFFVIA
jgi:hypothetical protein